MSENGGAGQPPAVQPAAQNVAMDEIPCPCGEKFGFRLPVPEVVNSGTVSMIVWAHERPAMCPYCNTVFVFRVIGLSEERGLQYGWQPVGKSNNRMIVAPPPGLDVSKLKGEH